MESHSLDGKSQVPYRNKIESNTPKSQSKTENKKPSEARDIHLSDLPKGIRNPPAQKVSMDEFKSQTKRVAYREPTGIDYGKLFSKIGRFFQQTAKFAEQGALASREFIRNPTILSKKKNIEEGVSSKEVSFSEGNKSSRSTSTLRVGTSNVGLDGVYGEFEKQIKDVKFQYKNDPNCEDENFIAQKYLEKNFEDLKTSMETLDLISDSQDLIDFLNKVDQLLQNKTTEVTPDQTERLTYLVNFLEKPENRKQLNNAVYREITDAKVSDKKTKALVDINTAIYTLYHFSKIHDKWESKEIDQSLFDYVKNKNLSKIDERLSQIKNNDVCFTQELNKDSSVIAKKLQESGRNFVLFGTGGSQGGNRPSLIINTERFKIRQIPKGDAKKSSEDNDFVMSEVEILLNSGKTRKDPIKIYDDQSFGGEKFRAVIATDKKTQKKVLLCSIHISGYTIGKADQAQRSKDLNIMRKVIEKIAADNHVDGIIMGGDFNSVEEKVGEFDSPLTHLKQAEFVPIPVASNTENAPYTYFQPYYPISRKIDHIWIKGKALIGSEGKVEGTLKDPLKQTTFDHLTVSAEIEIKKSWLKMLKHRFHHMKS